MARVFNATSICANKETGRFQPGDQDKLDKETAVMASPSNRPTAADGPGAQRDTDWMSASKFKETGQPLAHMSVISKLVLPPRTPQIPPTQPRGDMIALQHRVALVFETTPMYASKERGLPRVIVTGLGKLALPRTPQISCQ